MNHQKDAVKSRLEFEIRQSGRRVADRVIDRLAECYRLNGNQLELIDKPVDSSITLSEAITTIEHGFGIRDGRPPWVLTRDEVNNFRDVVRGDFLGKMAGQQGYIPHEWVADQYPLEDRKTG